MHLTGINSAIKEKMKQVEFHLTREDLIEEDHYESDFFDRIYSPFVIFSLFTLFGCVLGYIDFLRSKGVRRFPSPQPKKEDSTEV